MVGECSAEHPAGSRLMSHRYAREFAGVAKLKPTAIRQRILWRTPGHYFSELTNLVSL